MGPLRSGATVEDFGRSGAGTTRGFPAAGEAFPRTGASSQSETERFPLSEEVGDGPFHVDSEDEPRDGLPTLANGSSDVPDAGERSFEVVSPTSWIRPGRPTGVKGVRTGTSPPSTRRAGSRSGSTGEPPPLPGPPPVFPPPVFPPPLEPFPLPIMPPLNPVFPNG